MQVLGAPTDLSTLESAINQLKSAVEAKPDSHIKSVQRGEVASDRSTVTVPINPVNSNKCKVNFSIETSPGGLSTRRYSNVKAFFHHSVNSNSLVVFGDNEQLVNENEVAMDVHSIIWELTEYA